MSAPSLWRTRWSVFTYTTNGDRRIRHDCPAGMKHRRSVALGGATGCRGPVLPHNRHSTALIDLRRDFTNEGVRNYLIEGVSGTGKSSVCRELRRRGYHAIDGDRDLAYQGDPETGRPTASSTHEHHIWPVDRVRVLVANQDEAVTFFCGGSRNFANFVDLFDGVFVLEVDLATLNRPSKGDLGMSGAGHKPNGNTSHAFFERKKTSRGTAWPSMPPHRLPTSLTRSSVQATNWTLMPVPPKAAPTAPATRLTNSEGSVTAAPSGRCRRSADRRRPGVCGP